jgi:hypothetical protein
MPMTSPSFLLRPALLVLAMAGAQNAVADEPLAVMIDHAKVMHISKPADIVIIGNPGIADATIQDKQTLIITGRSFGSTNLIVLDADGKAIAEETISVTPSEDNVVTVYRTVDKRLTRQTYSCTPRCAPTLALGDEEKAFSAASAQIKERGDFSKGPAQ